MEMPNYADHDGLGLAELVAKRAVTPLELVEAAIARIEEHNPTLNAVVYKGYDDARKWAIGDLPAGPFRGVPFLIKDLGMPVAGWPRSHGSKFARGVVDSQDGGLTTRYRAAGVVPIGKTNTPEYGITGTTESAALGPCRNPWNPGHIAGGSSGGAASAVAAGIVPLAHASDGLGSIRIPAACCGLVGLKVTRDRNPNLPDGFDYALGNVVDHVVTRTVRDSAAMLDATGYAEPHSPYAAPPKERPYLEEIERSPGKLRIAWSSETPSGRPIDPEIQAALERTAALLKGLGHEVIEKGLGIDYRALFASRGPAAASNFAAGMARLIDLVGREPEQDELEPLTWSILKAGRRQTGADALRSLQETRMLNRQTLAFFEEVDVYLTPVLGTPVPEIGFIDPVNLEPREVNRRQGRTFPYTPPFNFSGQPSMSLPLEMDAAGLPIGMMFSARYADEATLFRLAAQLEKEAPWKGRRPQVWG
ncbi:MAG TPA: amidase family protein [Phenylobacterium sp.]|jgi:amidase|uniref:amidase n=1 Tax=Phenylobacterium sp. TaxID=1871053 RepID=UPI002D4430E7|nr:amidase family protein [Phenylobacterium sp.]HZZ66590.1 amidase family protein [Phenylobacterium sp.]